VAVASFSCTSICFYDLRYFPNYFDEKTCLNSQITANISRKLKRIRPKHVAKGDLSVNPCYFHPDAVAGAICVKCGVPICPACTQSVGVKTSCPSCVDYGRQYATAAPIASAQTSATSASPAAYKSGTDSSYYTQIFAGLGLGFAIGSILSVLVMKVLFYAHFGISFLYIAVGYGVGFGIHKVTGRGGAGLASAGVAVMLLSLLVGHCTYVYDLLGALHASGQVPDTFSFFDAFGPVLQSLGVMHWVCIAIGVGACFRAIEAQGN